MNLHMLFTSRMYETHDKNWPSRNIQLKSTVTAIDELVSMLRPASNAIRGFVRQDVQQLPRILGYSNGEMIQQERNHAVKQQNIGLHRNNEQNTINYEHK